ncbi:hypothetical protein [Paucisalibacillus globulus]|uniref:hypothetical protein n=1 Tax=Paucisalibacillus globulus TaxID=351095 RepID=UPI000BB75F88|nr:hypothetical protein [Paucisalibacillus globulus]
MRRMKKILFVLLAVILVLPSFLVTANTNGSNSDNDKVQGEGKIASKDEVVYATLDASGKEQDIYVVNSFDITKAGTVTDYGFYSNLKNLTDLDELEQTDNAVQFTASEGKFYYQGNINEATLPWDIKITYFLDGKEFSPEELAGKDGQVQIRMETNANKQANPVFGENYLLQISLALNSDIYSNIQAEDGMIANAGKNKQVTFTVMPEEEAVLVLEADVTEFELDGINFTGIPSTMPIEAPDMDEMTGDITTLSEAIAEINDGVGELNNGVSELNSGVTELVDGSKQYQNGMVSLDQSSGELISGSKEINQALEMLNNSLNTTEEPELSGIQDLMGGLKQLSDGLGEAASGLEILKQNYEDLILQLDNAMKAIPAYDITEQDIRDLESSNADQEIIQQLLDTYEAAMTAKETYAVVGPGVKGLNEQLVLVVKSLREMAANVDLMNDELASSLEENDMEGLVALQEGIAKLAANYDAFHSGLLGYTDGVSKLSDSYQELHNGITVLSGGTSELESGVSELHDGTNELHESTSNLPEQMTEEIDGMIAEYDKSDFEVVSFVSSKNEKVNSVQFVFKTESIKYEEPEVVEEPIEEEKGFWDLFLDLFR